ncbi:hypothetical protein RFJ91_00840 [Streptococcus suis]|uniref:hypothetical protein n=1 Tax=Streptococcus suis TaxID=1307 RepID=UPI002FC78FE6
MTNEKLGVLLVDVPEPKLFCYMFIVDVGICGKSIYTTTSGMRWLEKQPRKGLIIENGGRNDYNSA